MTGPATVNQARDQCSQVSSVPAQVGVPLETPKGSLTSALPAQLGQWRTGLTWDHKPLVPPH